MRRLCLLILHSPEAFGPYPSKIFLSMFNKVLSELEGICGGGNRGNVSRLWHFVRRKGYQRCISDKTQRDITSAKSREWWQAGGVDGGENRIVGLSVVDGIAPSHPRQLALFLPFLNSCYLLISFPYYKMSQPWNSASISPSAHTAWPGECFWHFVWLPETSALVTCNRWPTGVPCVTTNKQKCVSL